MDVNKFTSVWDIGQMAIGDLISKPFDAVKESLFDYKTHPDPDKAKEVRMIVQTYLKEMNSNTSMPFSHRLRVVDTLGSYINVLQAIAVPNLLETYDKIIAPVAEKSVKNPLFAEALVELVAIAFHLIISDLQRTLAEYRPISPVAVRRALSYMHTVVKIFRHHKLPTNIWFVRLNQMYVVHELLRTVNTYAMTTHNQKTAIIQLRKHMEAGVSVRLNYFIKGEPIQHEGLALITDPQKPHATPKRVMRVDDKADTDLLLLDFDALAKKALAEMRHARKKIGPENQGQHGDYVMVADAFLDAIALGEMMREVMFTRPRQFPRQRPQGKQSVVLDTDIQHGLQLLYSQQRNIRGDECLIAAPDKHRVWQVVDMSQGGFYLEQMRMERRQQQIFSTHQDDGDADAPAMEVGILISYALIAPVASPMMGEGEFQLLESGLARTSWFRVSTSEVKSVGLAKIMGGEIVFVKVMKALLSTTAADKFHGWMKKINDNQLHLWSTQNQIAVGTPLTLRTINGTLYTCTVGKMVERGVNYVVHMCNLDVKDGSG